MFPLRPAGSGNRRLRPTLNHDPGALVAEICEKRLEIELDQRDFDEDLMDSPPPEDSIDDT